MKNDFLKKIMTRKTVLKHFLQSAIADNKS